MEVQVQLWRVATMPRMLETAEKLEEGAEEVEEEAAAAAEGVETETELSRTARVPQTPSLHHNLVPLAPLVVA